MSKDITTQCSWGNTKFDKDYHDTRWCKPVHDDDELFAMLCLEGMQAGLSWTVILKKEQAIRDAFRGLTPKSVINLTDADLDALKENPDIICHKLKLKAVVANGQAFMKVQDEFGSFDNYIWRFTNYKTIVNHPKAMTDIAVQSELSDRISKDLKKRGFKFVGPVIIYSYLQAIGILNDHLDMGPYK